MLQSKSIVIDYRRAAIMGLSMIAGMTAAVATYANSQEDSPLIWGVIAFVLTLVGGILFGSFGQLGGGFATFAFLQLKIMKFG